ncbi:hypothetical protein BZG36_04600 [Bifiguratus adelaidae]|uniref:Mif2/CENP-C cupin domain-containing protein n=1 Tax=Bifiguratus adelaidae TaxID=1938954 RepID=A0A261XWG3_9FUNG|nr:hypothetical protein BZG36_04600 [Bifiguratus adelaidae]
MASDVENGKTFRNRNADRNKFTDIGIVGRKTGVSVKGTVRQDADGLENISDFFHQDGSDEEDEEGQEDPGDILPEDIHRSTRSPAVSSHEPSKRTIVRREVSEHEEFYDAKPMSDTNHHHSQHQLSPNGEGYDGYAFSDAGSEPTTPITPKVARILDFKKYQDTDDEEEPILRKTTTSQTHVNPMFKQKASKGYDPSVDYDIGDDVDFSLGARSQNRPMARRGGRARVTAAGHTVSHALHSNDDPDDDFQEPIQPIQPVKRGRGRPRKIEPPEPPTLQDVKTELPMSEATDPPKRGRGRAHLNSLTDQPTPKRPRGRPRKNPVPQPVDAHATELDDGESAMPSHPTPKERRGRPPKHVNKEPVLSHDDLSQTFAYTISSNSTSKGTKRKEVANLLQSGFTRKRNRPDYGEGDEDTKARIPYDSVSAEALVVDVATESERYYPIVFTDAMLQLTRPDEGNYGFQKIFAEGDHASSGLLVLPPGGVKPNKRSYDSTFMFFVIAGVVKAYIHKNAFTLPAGSHFMVPRGNHYELQNEGSQECRLLFMQCRQQVSEVPSTTEEDDCTWHNLRYRERGYCTALDAMADLGFSFESDEDYFDEPIQHVPSIDVAKNLRERVLNAMDGSVGQTTPPEVQNVIYLSDPTEVPSATPFIPAGRMDEEAERLVHPETPAPGLSASDNHNPNLPAPSTPFFLPLTSESTNGPHDEDPDDDQAYLDRNRSQKQHVEPSEALRQARQELSRTGPHIPGIGYDGEEPDSKNFGDSPELFDSDALLQAMAEEVTTADLEEFDPAIASGVEANAAVPMITDEMGQDVEEEEHMLLDDQSLTPLERIYLFTKSDLVFHRIYAARELSGMLQAVSVSDAIEIVIPLINGLAVDNDDSVRESFVTDLDKIILWYYEHCPPILGADAEASESNNGEAAEEVTPSNASAHASNEPVPTLTDFASSLDHTPQTLSSSPPSTTSTDNDDISMVDEAKAADLPHSAEHTPEKTVGPEDIPLPDSDSAQSDTSSAQATSGFTNLPPGTFIPVLTELLLDKNSTLATLTQQCVLSVATQIADDEALLDAEIFDGLVLGLCRMVGVKSCFADTDVASGSHANTKTMSPKPMESLDDGEASLAKMVCLSLISVLANVLGVERCEKYCLPIVQELASDPIFYVRKEAATAIGCLATVLLQSVMVDTLLPLYKTFAKDTIWHVRRSCVLALPAMCGVLPEDLRAHFAVENIEHFRDDASRSVRSALGEVIGEIIAKFLPPHWETTRQPGAVPDALLDYFLSLSSNPGPGQMLKLEPDRTVICAYNFPAVILTAGAQKWDSHLKDAYLTLTKDYQIKVRRTFAYSLHEIASVIGPEKAERDLVQIFAWYLMDLDQVKEGVLEHLADFLSALAPSSRNEYVPILAEVWDGVSNNWRLRDILGHQLRKLCYLFDASKVVENVLPLVWKACSDTIASVRETGVTSFPAILQIAHEEDARQQNDEQHLLDEVLTSILGFSGSTAYRGRVIYAQICLAVISEEEAIHFFDEYLLPKLEKLAQDSIVDVRIAVARCMQAWCSINVYKEDENGTDPDVTRNIISHILNLLASDSNLEVVQFVTPFVPRRFQDNENGILPAADIDADMTAQDAPSQTTTPSSISTPAASNPSPPPTQPKQYPSPTPDKPADASTETASMDYDDNDNDEDISDCLTESEILERRKGKDPMDEDDDLVVIDRVQ